MISRKYTIEGNRISIVKKAGKRVYSPFLSVAFLPNGLPHQRFAAEVSLKVSKVAVYRNYIKRAILEGARRTLYNSRFGADILIFALNVNAKRSFEETISECEILLKKVEMLFGKVDLQINPKIVNNKTKHKTFTPRVLVARKNKQ